MKRVFITFLMISALFILDSCSYLDKRIQPTIEAQVKTAVQATISRFTKVPTSTAYPTTTPYPTYTLPPTQTPKIIIVTPTLTRTPKNTATITMTPTVTLTPSKTFTPKPTNTSTPIYHPLMTNVWRGVKVYYGEQKTYAFEILGVSFDCPFLPSKKGIKVLYSDGTEEWKDRLYLVGSGYFYVRQGDPALDEQIWYEYPFCW